MGVGVGKYTTAESSGEGEVGPEGKEGACDVLDGRHENGGIDFRLLRIRTRMIALGW